MSLLQRHGHGVYSWYQCFESCCQRSLPGNEVSMCPMALQAVTAAKTKPWLATRNPPGRLLPSSTNRVQRHHVLHSHGNGFRLAHEPFLDVNGDRTCSAKSKACNPVKTLARWHDNLRRQCACMATCAVMSGNLPASMPLPVACSCSSSAPGGIQELCAHACLMHEHTGERWSLYCAGAVRMGTFHAHEGSFMGLLHWVCFASPSGSSVVTAPL